MTSTNPASRPRMDETTTLARSDGAIQSQGPILEMLHCRVCLPLGVGADGGVVVASDLGDVIGCERATRARPAPARGTASSRVNQPQNMDKLSHLRVNKAKL
eukprot:4196223-Pleurochrysis_carterae.AAC.1